MFHNLSRAPSNEPTLSEICRTRARPDLANAAPSIGRLCLGARAAPQAHLEPPDIGPCPDEPQCPRHRWPPPAFTQGRGQLFPGRRGGLPHGVAAQRRSGRRMWRSQRRPVRPPRGGDGEGVLPGGGRGLPRVYPGGPLRAPSRGRSLGLGVCLGRSSPQNVDCGDRPETARS